MVIHMRRRGPFCSRWPPPISSRTWRPVWVLLPRRGLAEAIRDSLAKALGLSVTDGARVLGVTRPALSALLNERVHLSPAMALRIEKAVGVSMDTLMRMQNSYDIAQTHKLETDIKLVPFEGQASTWHSITSCFCDSESWRIVMMMKHRLPHFLIFLTLGVAAPPVFGAAEPLSPHFQFDVLHPDLPAAFSVFIHRG